MRVALRSLLVLLVFSVFQPFFAQDAHAIFSLSVAPRKGGQDLRFEQSAPGSLLRNEEVTVTVVSDRQAQYRILQSIYQPLTNENGDTIPQAAFIVFSPSNPSGTLKPRLETPLMMGQMPLYTSNASGDSEEIVLVFNVHVPADQPGGQYRTQITFTAELINAESGISTSVVNMDVVVNIRPTFRFVVESKKGGRILDLGKISKEKPSSNEAIKVDIESNVGTTYRVIQELTEPFTSQEGEILDESVISMTFAGGEKGTVASGNVPLESGQQLLYTSEPSGEGDVFEILYSTNPESSQKAGIYSGNISFRVDSGSAYISSGATRLPARIEIEPMFYLDVDTVGSQGLQFGTFKTGKEEQSRQVKLAVRSNLGQQYQVSQVVTRKLTNPEGATLPKEKFLVYGSDAKTGVLSVMSPTPVSEGETVLFTSNAKGDPEQFMINYTLSVPAEARGGSYNTEIIYSITTL